MQTLEMHLATHPFFAGLEPSTIQRLAGLASPAHYKRGKYLFHEGEQAAHFYIINEGKVALETFAGERGAIPIETSEPGEVLGWSWLFPPYRWHFGARVVEPTKTIVLEGAGLRARCEEDHHFGYELTKRIAQVMMQRLQATRLQLLDLYGT
jgi:CRP/FNR family cyclic AMP-dependent transcriptional regulator